MNLILTVLLFVIILGAISSIVVKKGVSGLKLMLLGLNITLFGGIIAVDPNSGLGGIEYLIALLGVIISIVGLGKKE